MGHTNNCKYSALNYARGILKDKAPMKGLYLFNYTL